MPNYEYRCSGCGRAIESGRILAPGTKHMTGNATERRRKTCGTLKRVWSANFNHVPGGARNA